MIQVQPPPSEEEIISPSDIFLVLARHIKLIIIIPSIFCTLMIIYVFFIAQPIYVSISTFMSSDSGSGGGQSGMMGLASQFGFSMPTTNSGPRWSYEEVIKSRKMAKSLLQHRFDTEKYGPNKTLLQILTYGDKQSKLSRDILESKGVEIFQELIKIENDIISDVYTLKVNSIEPQLSSDIVSVIIEKLDKILREYNANKTTKTRQFIEERLEDTMVELEDSEEALKVFRERNRSILGSPQLQLEQERLGRDVSVLIGIFTTLKQELERAKIEEVKELDYVVILDSPETPVYPSKPKKKFMVILAGFLGIGLGMVLAWIRNYAQNCNEEEQDKIGKAKSLLFNNLISFIPSKSK